MEDKLVFDSQPALGGGGTLVLWGALGVLRRFSCLAILGGYGVSKATPHKGSRPVFVRCCLKNRYISIFKMGGAAAAAPPGFNEAYLFGTVLTVSDAGGALLFTDCLQLHYWNSVDKLALL